MLGVLRAGETCVIDVGEEGVFDGQLLKPDADGKAVKARSGDFYSAEALETAEAGGEVQALVVRGKK